MVNTRRMLAAAGAAVMVAALALSVACGDDEDEADGGNAGGEGTVVSVTLKEFEVLAATASVAAGEITFQAKNEGPEDPHELVVVKTDLAVDALPVKDGKVDEDQVEVIGEIEEFEPGATEEATFDLEPGKYVLLCNIAEEEDGKLESHYELGMRAALTVE